MAEFGKKRYNVDVLKVEVPIQMEFVAGTKAFKGEKAYTRKEALQHFRDAAATSTHKPFIYLSAGVSNPVFIETLELAGESGTSSTAFSAAARPGRTASPSTPSRARRPSRHG